MERVVELGRSSRVCRRVTVRGKASFGMNDRMNYHEECVEYLRGKQGLTMEKA